MQNTDHTESLSVDFDESGNVVAASGPGVSVDAQGNIIVPGLEPKAPAKHPSSDGLRKLADWLDTAAAHGVVPDYFGDLDISFVNYVGYTHIEALPLVAAELRTFTKEYSDHYLTLRRGFGGVNAVFRFHREEVCKRVVVGVERVPETVIPAVPAQPERVIPATTREKVEWQCGESLLSKAFQQIEEAA